MVGSTQSIAGANFVLNTIVADTLADIADELEKAENVNATAQKILKKITIDHRKIIFNGDNYGDSWVMEAQKRGLPNINSTVESLKTLTEPQNIKLFERHNVLSNAELNARTEILLENYSMTINIEALTMLNIAKRKILPATAKYSQRLADTVNTVSTAGAEPQTQKKMLDKVCELIDSLYANVEVLENAVAKATKIEDVCAQAENYHQNVVPTMQAVRKDADELETIVDADLWPLPTYPEMLFLR